MTSLLLTFAHHAGSAESTQHLGSAFQGLGGLWAGRRAIRDRTEKRGKLPEDERRRNELDMLCRFIGEATTLKPRNKPGPHLADMLHRIFQLESAAIFDVDLDEIYQAGVPFENLPDTMRNICIFGTVTDDSETGISRRVLLMGDLPIGALLLRGETHGGTATTLASLIAITFDRYHALANESRTESARQAEQLRTTVLDSLAHAYKTPLTAISAASEGLSALGKLSAAQTNLVALIDEQTKALTRLTTRLLKTSKLDATQMIPHLDRVAISPLIEDVVASLADQLANVTVEIELSRDDMSLRCDRGLIIGLLTQFVDNAAKYGDIGSIVTIRATEHPTEVILSVHSFGPVIPAADIDRVFDRFFRSSVSESRVPGTGIGLSVAKRSAQAHGGHVWATSSAEKGTAFYASIPLEGANQ